MKIANLNLNFISRLIAGAVLAGIASIQAAEIAIFVESPDAWTVADGDLTNYGAMVVPEENNPAGTGEGFRVWDNNATYKPSALYTPGTPFTEPFRVSLKYYNNVIDSGERGPKIAMRMSNAPSTYDLEKSLTTTSNYHHVAEFFSNGQFGSPALADPIQIDTVGSVSAHQVDYVYNITGNSFSYTLYGSSRTLNPWSVDMFLDGVLLSAEPNGSVLSGKADFDQALGVGVIGFTSQSNGSVLGDFTFDDIVIYTGEDLEKTGEVEQDPLANFATGVRKTMGDWSWHPGMDWFYREPGSPWIFPLLSGQWLYGASIPSGGYCFYDPAAETWIWSEDAYPRHYYSYQDASWTFLGLGGFTTDGTYGPWGQPVGYATLGPGVTGGEGGTQTTVTSLNQLASAVSGNAPKIVIVSGMLSGDVRVEVGSNTTIIGEDANAHIEGTGLRIDGVSNVIVRNLTISRVPQVSESGGDAIGIYGGSTNVWIDHCEFFGDLNADKDYYDGLIDVRDASHNITISWNYIHDHYKTMLYGSSDSDTFDVDITVTLHHNYFKDCESRIPSLRFGTLHAFNNLYVDCHDAVNSRMGACARLESNHFMGTPSPFKTVGPGNTDGAQPEGGLELINNWVWDANQPLDDTPACMVDVPYAYQQAMDPVEDVAHRVMLFAGPH